MEELKRLIGLVSIGLLVGLIVFGPSLAAAQRVTVSRGQTFKVHVSVYKPAGVSFPENGALLYAFLYEPGPTWTVYNVGGTSANLTSRTWGNEENQENFSLQITVSDDTPAKSLSLRVRLKLDENTVYETSPGSDITVTMMAIEVDGENTELSIETTCTSNLSTGEQGTTYWHDTFGYYVVDAAISDVLITAAGAELPLPTWAVVVIGILVVVIIALVAAVRRRQVAGAPPPPEPLEVPRE